MPTICSFHRLSPRASHPLRALPEKIAAGGMIDISAASGPACYPEKAIWNRKIPMAALPFKNTRIEELCCGSTP